MGAQKLLKFRPLSISQHEGAIVPHLNTLVDKENLYVSYTEVVKLRIN